MPAPVVAPALLAASGLVAATLAHQAELTPKRHVGPEASACGVASERPVAMLDAAAGTLGSQSAAASNIATDHSEAKPQADASGKAVILICCNSLRQI